MSRAIGLGYGSEPYQLQELNLDSDINYRVITPEPPYVGFSRVAISGEKYRWRKTEDYEQAASQYVLSMATGFGSVEDVENIKEINLFLFNSDGETPVTRAIHGFHIEFYNHSTTEKMCSYSVYSKSGTTCCNAYYDGVSLDKTPLAITLGNPDQNENKSLTLELTSNALVPGKTTRLVFDTTIYYQVEVLYNYNHR